MAKKKTAWGPGNPLYEWKKQHGRGTVKRSRRLKVQGGSMAKKSKAHFGGRSRKAGIDANAILMRGVSSMAGPSKPGNEIGETITAGLSGIGAAAVLNSAVQGKIYNEHQAKVAGAIGGGLPGLVAVTAVEFISAELAKRNAGPAASSDGSQYVN